MTRKVCVVGSNSFSGANFCQHLLNQGYEVIAMSRSAEPVDALLPYKWVSADKLKNLQFHQLDLNQHLPEIEALLDKEKPAHIYNFAAQSMVGQSWEFPEHWFMTNAVSTVKFHNVLRHKDYMERYIHISTPEVYGSCSGFVKEDHVFNPSTPYAVSRAAADMSLKTFFDVHGFPVISTRAANVYGEGQQLYRIIPKTIMCILLGEKLPLHGGGHSERAFIHMDDVSDATLKIAEKGEVGSTYHISTKETISIRGLVVKICDMMGVKFEDVCEVTDDRLGKDAAYLLDATRLRETLDWQDQISLDEGLERTIKWARDNFDVLKAQPNTYIHKP
ncbi:GDP-mannose 4,6-dehydratase [Paraneptunicella aestuarii]|uniref:GDP-mannose 4,6-dehydratase n=1 Tax=Paraneptunicella aestuarii TaxID=2831148 RepID=UPI001E3330DF|nr:GDP-mannose 4,6-dehydratase [Paraneptunicella aestuarii]UAA39511.1 GDP-mannose 4,6-dehydratase [Paraneptunicella aestuarii]